jgi:hypothetical protein
MDLTFADYQFDDTPPDTDASPAERPPEEAGEED